MFKDAPSTILAHSFPDLKLLLATFAIAFISAGSFGQSPSAANGVLDARDWDFKNARIQLSGIWSYYEDQLLSPGDSGTQTNFVFFPKIWNEIRDSEKGIGYATYRLTVLLPPKTPSLAIELPQIYCSYDLSMNGRSVASNGKVGKSKEETTPQWLPQVVSFESHTDTLNINLQIANFHHNKGGSRDPIYLGSGEFLQQQHAFANWSNIAEAALLIVVGFSFLVVYWGSDKKKITVYFALLCITWGIRSLFYNQYLFITFFPDFDWTVAVKTEYITLYLSLIWALLFTHRLFPNEGTNVIKYLLVGINIFYILFVLLAAPIQFTYYISVYLFTIGVVMFYCVVLVLRAWINERMGVVFLVVSMLLGVLIFAYDLFAYEGFFMYNSVIFSIGYLIVFLLMAPALLMHLKIMKSRVKPSNLLTYKDLYGEPDQ